MALGSPTITGKAFSEFSVGRRSTRVFKADPVSREVVERIVGTAIEAPTACNRQLWHFVVIDDPQMKVKVCRMSDAQQSYLHDAPILIAAFYDTSLEPRNPCNTAQVSMGMAIYGLLLAAEAEGVGSIYLGGIRSPRGCEKALGAPSYWKNYGFICMGYRADDPPAPIPRKPQEVISYNEFSLKEKRFHMDIRPHLWSLSQLADFRDKLIWYKGIAIDGKTLHVDPDTRFSSKFNLLAARAGMAAQEFEKPAVMDILSSNGDLLHQLILTIGKEAGEFLAYDLTQGIEDFIEQRFVRIYDSLPYQFLCNDGLDRIGIPRDDASVHVVTCYERLDHFEDPEPLLKELRRVIHPNGRMIVCVSGRFYPHLYRYRRMRKKNYALGRNWNRGPERKYNPSSIESHFKNTSWEVVSLEGYQPITLKFLSIAERAACKIKQTSWGDRLAAMRRDHLVTTKFDRRFCSSLIYELKPC
ncbi:MAG: nitroreductase family protein [Verrucomicrobiota bacterium]